MNRQPYGRPPRWWEPKLSPQWVRLTRRYRHRQLRRKQKLIQIEADGLERLRAAVDANCGVLIAPNHAAHYDSEALYEAADRIKLPLYFMTAWQVFGMSNRLQRWLMQRLGCFSIDRESSDRKAFKQAVELLQHDRHPLVIFPEGDIYHTTDIVTPFRDGAAAIALAAARKTDRPIVVMPCGIKFWYIDDPTDQLRQDVRRIEDRLLLRPGESMPLTDRVHRLAEAALALKELDYLGETRSGRLRDRVGYLLNAVLVDLECRHGLAAAGTPPERVKQLRQAVIHKQDEAEQNGGTSELVSALENEMADLFFATQLFSYRGDYLAGQPTVERLAETLDKFEEDIMGLEYPRVRGRRCVSIKFGDPLPVSPTDRGGAERLTETMQESVQSLIDAINAARPSSPLACGS